MKTLREGLICGLLLIAVIRGLQATYLLAQLGRIGQRVEEQAVANGLQLRTTLLYTQAVLSSIRQTSEIVHRSAEQQMGYYEAMGRRGSLALARLNLLIEHTDDRIERITLAAEQSSGKASAALEEYGRLAADGVDRRAATRNPRAKGRRDEHGFEMPGGRFNDRSHFSGVAG
jgi:hypothetical protein